MERPVLGTRVGNLVAVAGGRRASSLVAVVAGLVIAPVVALQPTHDQPATSRADAAPGSIVGASRPGGQQEQPAATPAPTPMPFVVYLPSACMAGEPALRADIVLLVDTSASMAGSRLDAVRLAAAYLLDQMNPELDHAAVIGFDRSPRTAVHMTADRREIDRGLASLRSGSSSTRFDLAIAVARRELLYDGGERDFDNRGVIVMLSDGRHDGEANDAIAEAFFTGTAGFAIYTVGLGPDADQDLLNAIADTGAHVEVSLEAGLSPAFDAIGRHIRRSRGWCGSAWGVDPASSDDVGSYAAAG